MRFAGTRIEGFMGGDDSPNFGQMAQKSHAIRNKEETTATDLMGQTAATGIKAAGDVEAAKIDGQARSALASAQGQASMMKSIGSIGSSLIGAIPTGGGGGGIGDWSGGGVATSGMDYSSAFNDPGTFSFSNFTF